MRGHPETAIQNFAHIPGEIDVPSEEQHIGMALANFSCGHDSSRVPAQQLTSYALIIFLIVALVSNTRKSILCEKYG